MATAIELSKTLTQKREELAELFKKHKTDEGYNFTSDQLEEVNRRNDELNTLHDEWMATKSIEEMAEANGREVERLTELKARPPFGGDTDGGAREPERKERVKRWGDAFVSSAAYKERSDSRFQVSMDVPTASLKATLLRGDLESYDEQTDIKTIGNERLRVQDLLATGTTTSPTIRYMQEVSYTNAATTVTEGTAKPEATFELEQVDAPVEKIGVWVKVTDEMFADYTQVRDYVNNRLAFMVREREELQLLNGNGTPPNIRGILQTNGILTQAKGADPTPDAIYKAITKVRTQGFFEPDGIVMHPNDWQDIRLLRTTDGIYIWGSPADVGPERVWGYPVVNTTNMVENTALVGAFRVGAQEFIRETVRVEATNTDQDDFIKNLVTIRAEMRIALAVYRPKAFATVTGI